MLPFQISSTGVECGRAMQTLMPGEWLNQRRRRLVRCVVSELTFVPTEQVVAAVTGPSVSLANLETMLKHLLPAVPAQAPPPLSAPTDLKTMLKRLLPVVPAQAPPPHSAPTDIEAMLKHLLPGTPTLAPQPLPVTARRDWSSVLCFSCGKYGHAVGKCP